jgi:putative redox protein
METIVKVIDNVQFSVEARGHRVVCDQPRDDGGADGGMTPPELMLASLGTCAAYYVVQYLKFRNLPTADVQVRVEAEKVKDPVPRVGVFRIFVEAPEAIEEKHRAGMRRAAEKCLIHNTLLHPPAIEIEVHAPVAV